MSVSTTRSKSRMKATGGVPLAKSMRTVASSRKYDESGVVAVDSHEQKLEIAMKARRARRGEVVGTRTTTNARGQKLGTANKTVKIPKIEKPAEQEKLIRAALASNILFNDCTPEQIEFIVYAMRPKRVPKGIKVITEGDEGFNFYVVSKGKFKYSKNGEEIGEANVGDCFGELALLYYAPRAMTCTAVETSTLWKLDRNTFRLILDSSVDVKKEKTKEAFLMCPLLEDMDDSELDLFIDSCLFHSFRKSDVIIRKEDGHIFYIVVAGQVQVTKAGDDLTDIVFGPGDYFGERSLMTNEPRNANVIAIEDSDVAAIDRQTFDKFLGSRLQQLDNNLGIRVLKSVEILQDLTPLQFEELIEEMDLEFVASGTTILRQGDPGRKFYIIKSGTVDIFKGEEVREADYITTLTTGGHFGEMSFLDNVMRVATVVASTDCQLFSLDKDKFEELFGPLESLQNKKLERAEQLNLRKSGRESGNKVVGQASVANRSIKFEDLKMLSILGTGTFGVVRLVQHRRTKDTFALKTLQKQQIMEYDQQQNVLNEKEVLQECDHPFILKLYGTYQDRDRLFMLLELVQGGELFTLLYNSSERRLSEEHAKFYAFCVADAIEYLHNKDIVYRDLKPENLMIDTEGYIKVVDFGFSKKISGKTYTMCGTPEYLAPELVIQKGHGKAVDYWAMGVLVFEMLAGRSPFCDVNNDQVNIMRNIARIYYVFPLDFPKHAKKLVQKLLVKKPAERLGMGMSKVRRHSWFAGLSLKDLRSKEMATPWQPNIRSNVDTSCFEEYFDSDERNVDFTGDDKLWKGKF